MPGDATDAPLFNTAAVVQRTGVPAATFRAWERRYQFPHPHREESGQRLYSERDIRAIQWLHQQTGRGVSISRAISMLRQGFADSLEPLVAIPLGTKGAAPRSLAQIANDLIDTLLEFDAARAEALLAEAFSLHPLEDVCLGTIEPVLVEIGERWHGGVISVAEEHFASSFLRSRLLGLMTVYPQDSRQAPIIAACAPGEWHELGIAMVSLFLVRHGYRVHYLGPNLPVEELRTVLQRHHPTLVVFSATSEESARSLVSMAQLVAAAPEPRPATAYGGRVFNRQGDLRSTVPGTYLGHDAREALHTVRALLTRREPTARAS